MCDIANPTNLKTITGYKLVVEKDGKYYSYFTGHPINIGYVAKRTSLLCKTLKLELLGIIECNDETWDDKYSYHPMCGKVSCFASIFAARLLYSIAINWTQRTFNVSKLRIIQITLGGEIIEGTSKNIADEFSEKYKTYAGSKIISFKEVAITKN